MKYLSLLLFSVLTISFAFAQKIKTTYHDKNEVLSTIQNALFYRNLSLDTTINNIKIYKLEEYYSKNDLPKKIAFLTESENKSLNYFHEKREYYENGNLESFVKYDIQGKVIDTAYYCHPNGNLELITYNPAQSKDSTKNNNIKYLGYYDENQTALLLNGNGYLRLPILDYLSINNIEEGLMQNHLKHGKWRGKINNYIFEEEYENGNLIKGFSISPDEVKKEYNSTNSKNDPDYPGGIQALKTYIGTHYQYPQIAIENGIKGTIIAEIVIEPNGTVSNVKIIQDLGYTTAEAAIDLLKNLKQLIPGTIKRIPIKSSWIIPITLDLQVHY